MVNTKRYFLTFSIILILAYSFLPIVSLLPPNLKAIILIISTILFLAYLIMMKAYDDLIKTIVIMSLLIVFNLLYIQTVYNNDYFAKNVNFIANWLPIILSIRILKEPNYYKNKITKLALNLLIVTLITTIIGNIVFDKPSRFLAGTGNDQYRLFNIGGYGFIYAIVLIVPFMIYLYRKNKNVKYLFIMFLITFCVILSKYSFAIIFLVAILGIEFLMKRNIKKKISFIIVLALFIVIFRADIANFVLNYIENNQVDIILKERLMSFAKLLKDFEFYGNSQFRMKLYTQSFNTFLENPLFGMLFNKEIGRIGEHSEILDLLACLGLFGVFYLLFTLYLYKKGFSYKRNISFYRHFKIFIFFLGMLSLINTIRTSMEIFYIMFMIYVPTLYYTKETGNEELLSINRKKNFLMKK